MVDLLDGIVHIGFVLAMVSAGVLILWVVCELCLPHGALVLSLLLLLLLTSCFGTQNSGTEFVPMGPREVGASNGSTDRTGLENTTYVSTHPAS